jgi:hypothetical protein
MRLIRYGTVLVAAAAMLAGASSGLARTTAKAFPPGCWAGSGTWNKTENPNGTTVTFSKSTFNFKLHVTKHNAVGYLTIKGHASAEVTAVNATGEMNVTGDLDLTGKPGKVNVDGAYHLSGVVVSSGVDVPLELDVDVSGPMTITAVGKKLVTGRFDKQKYTAHRIKGSCLT